MRRIAALLLITLLAAASAPVVPAPSAIDSALAQAKTEAAAADKEAARLDRLAGQAKGAAARLAAEQVAAAQNIAAAEARISAGDAELRVVAAASARRQLRLDQAQVPIASLLAGLALMAERPPLLAIADSGGTDEMVKVRVLLDSSLPVIRQRTAGLAAELAQGRALEQAARAARLAMVRSRDALARRKQAFAALELRALNVVATSSRDALGVGDVALAAGETVETLSGEAAQARGAARLAAELAMTEPVPARPGADTAYQAPIAYQLPAPAPVVEGLGTVNASGVRARGLTLATARGAAIIAPAAGTVRFAGPFRSHDGIVVIDHGGGWLSLIVNLASPLKPGSRVAVGDPLGRALGPLGVELSHNGQRWSPALIAGSSGPLSNHAKAR